MKNSVVGIVRGLSRRYANGLEHQELHIRKRHAEGITFVDGQAVDIHMHLGGEVYRAFLRASPKLEVLWISPRLFASDGKRLTLAEVLARGEFVRNERVAIEVDGTTLVVRKRLVSDVALTSALATFSKKLRVSDEVTTQVLADIDAASGDLMSEQPTTRTALIEARIGQGQFRNDLLDRWEGGCAVTNCTVGEVLVASHIKPWRDCSNRERLDSYNGLLLLGTIDRLFDAGLISFDDSGKLLVSRSIAPDQLGALGLDRELWLRKCDARHVKYLEWHRTVLFRDDAED